MRKINLLSILLPAMMLVAMLASCNNSGSDSEKDDEEGGGDPAATLEAMAKKMKNTRDLSADEFVNIHRQALEAQIEFCEGDPSEDEIKEFKNAYSHYEDAFYKAAKHMDERDFDEDQINEMQDLKAEKDRAMKAFERKMRRKEK